MIRRKFFRTEYRVRMCHHPRLIQFQLKFPTAGVKLMQSLHWLAVCIKKKRLIKQFVNKFIKSSYKARLPKKLYRSTRRQKLDNKCISPKPPKAPGRNIPKYTLILNYRGVVVADEPGSCSKRQGFSIRRKMEMSDTGYQYPPPPQTKSM